MKVLQLDVSCFMICPVFLLCT